MISIRIKIIFVTIALTSLTGEIWGTWVRAEREAVVTTNISLFQAKQYYSDDGQEPDVPFLREMNLSLYGEYGITSYWSAGLYVPFKFMQSVASLTDSSVKEELFAFGDINLIQKIQFWQWAGFFFSVTLEIGLPVGKSITQSDKMLLTGYGKTNVMPKFAVAYSVWKLYMDSHFGFNKRFGEFSDEIHWGFLLGVSLIKNFIKFEVDFKAQNSLRNGANENISPRLFANNIEFYSYRLNLIYTFQKNMGITLDLKSAFHVRNFYKGLIYSLGYYVVF